jgi:hypothetical protein
MRVTLGGRERILTCRGALRRRADVIRSQHHAVIVVGRHADLTPVAADRIL